MTIQKPDRRSEDKQNSESRVQLCSRNASCWGAGINCGTSTIFTSDDVDDDKDNNDDICQIQFGQRQSMWCGLCNSSVKNGERQDFHAFRVVVMMIGERVVSEAPHSRRLNIDTVKCEFVKRPQITHYCRIYVQFKLVSSSKLWSRFRLILNFNTVI